MLEPYRVFIEERAARVLTSIEARKAPLDFIRSLAADPFQEGDFAEADAVERTIHTQLVNDYAISFYADHAAKEVKVLQVSRADQ